MAPQLNAYPPRVMHMGNVITMTKHGATANVNVSSTDTDGAVAVINYHVPPHDPGPAPHWHAHTREWWWVLDGTLAVTMGEKTITAVPGTSLYIPPRMVHTFWNPTGAPVAFLALMSPGGMERYFVELAANAELGTLNRIAATCDVWSPAYL